MTRSLCSLYRNLLRHEVWQGGKTLGALFLVAGTCIGGGMLVLPISMSRSGFLPSLLMMFLTALFMSATGLLFLEATLWMPRGAHVISLAREFLNKFGEGLCWIVYLFICYASLVAYISGGGKDIAFVFSELLSLPLSKQWGSLLFFLGFSSLLGLGFRFVERVNTILFISMMVAYLFLVAIAPKEIQLSLLARHDWNLNALFSVVPLMLTTFSFPGIVPTIVPYLDRNVHSVRIAILGGTGLTFFVYLVWLSIVLGTIPYEGSCGLQRALLHNIPATEALHHAVENLYFSYIAQFFAFFALTTSFLGIALSLYDFLCDGFSLKKKGGSGFLLVGAVGLPSLFFALYFERAFLAALELSGGIGDSIISGVVPVLIVWRGRYHFSKRGSYQLGGGKPLLCALGFFSFAVLVFEVLRRSL